MAEKPKTFQRRTGVGGFPRWRGVVKEGRPSAIGYDRLRDGINIRLGDEIENRGGQSKVNTVAVDECIYGIFDAQAEEYGSNARLWIAGGEAAPSGAYTLSSYHPDDSPTFQNIILNADAGVNGRPMFVRDGSLYFGDVAASGQRDVCQLVRFTPPPGDSVLEAGGFSFVRRFAAPGSASAVTDLLSTVSYLGTFNVSGTVSSWDSTSFKTDSGAVFGTIAPIMISFREDVYGFSEHIFRKRAGGTWSSITMPVGLTSFFPNDWTVFNNTLYVGGFDRVGGNNHVSKILAFDGTTLTVARTPESSGFDSEGVMTVTTAFDHLYYAWKQVSDGSLVLGRFDGSTWTDSHKDMSAAGVGLLVRTGYDMLQFRGDLFMVVEEETPVSTVRLIRSSASATSSAWTLVKNIGDVSTFDVGGGDWLVEF